MNWLREHMRDQLESTSADPSENILNFSSRVSSSPSTNVESTLDLIDQAAEVIRNIRDRAIESETCAKSLAETAVDKLRRAEAHIQAAEGARDAAQKQLAKVEAQLMETERRLRQAEMRAINAENAMKKLDEAVRARIDVITKELTKKFASAA